MRKLLIITLYFASLLAAGCSIHKLSVQQGNVVTADMAEQLTIGMTRRQVQFIMGTPLIQDPTRPNRWDYVYALEPGEPRAKMTLKRLSVYFEDDRLVRIEQRFPDKAETKTAPKG